jgi:hypothetical protein
MIAMDKGRLPLTAVDVMMNGWRPARHIYDSGGPSVIVNSPKSNIFKLRSSWA